LEAVPVPARTPSYRLHRPTGQAVVTLNGRDVYLGKHGSPVSLAEYDRLVGEWLANGRHLSRAGDLTVTELILAYFRFAEGYYRKNGAPTTEVESIRLSLRPLRRLYGATPARDFGPLALKAVRKALVESGLCRNEVNKRTGRVVRCFKWAVENEMIPPSIHHGLKAVAGLRKGRSEVRESDPVKPVPDELVEAVRPHVSRQVWAMVELQRLTGMRPGEVVIMRGADLDRSEAVWTYTPSTHKTEHRGRTRKIFLGPRAQEVLRPWLKNDLSAFLFSPREAMAEFRAGQRRDRKTRLYPSQRDRRPKADPKRALGDHYSTRTYNHAIGYGCRRAGVETWAPNRLRHNAATFLRREFGLDAARAILGHRSPAVTEVYAEVDRNKAIQVMREVG
jgi:integrase